VELASATRANSASPQGWASSAVVEIADFALLNAVSMAGDHTILLLAAGEPFNAAVSGCRSCAAAGKNFL